MRTFNSPYEFFLRATAWAYRCSLRHLMPVCGTVSYAGVVTDVDRKVGDSILIPSFFESELADIPDYEEALVRGLNMYLQRGCQL
jgi:hypothetical protein